MHTQRSVVAVVTLCSLFIAALLLPHAAAAGEAREPAKRLAEVTISANRVDWQPAEEHERLTLTVAGPGDLYIQREFEAGEAPSFSLDTRDGRLPDGIYAYELRAGDREPQWGHLWVQAGSFKDKVPAPPRPVKPAASTSKPPLRNVTADTTISGDLIVQGQACIGEDCVNADGPALKIKEIGNYQILFEGLNCCFPWEGRWALQANEPGSNGDFTIRDVTYQKVPFRIMPLAPDNSLTIYATGNIGIGTLTPAVRLHVFENVNANTLATVENSNTGTNAAAFLRAKSDVGSTQISTHSSGRTITRFGQTLGGRGEILHTGGNGLVMGTLEADDLILGTNNTNRLQISGSTGTVTVSGNLTVNGTFSNPSSRALKEGFEPLDPKTVLDKFGRLPIQEWSYKSDDRKLRHIGPTVEDFQAAFGLGTEGQHIFPMDVQGVTMTAVQGLYQVVQEKDAEIAELRQRLADLEDLVSKLAATQ